MTKLRQFLKPHWLKILSLCFFVLLLVFYSKIFAIGDQYEPGETLDPNCSPGELNCTVDISAGSSWIKSGSDIYFDSGNIGIGTDTPTSLLTLNGDMRVLDESIIYFSDPSLFSASYLRSHDQIAEFSGHVKFRNQITLPYIVMQNLDDNDGLNINNYGSSISPWGVNDLTFSSSTNFSLRPQVTGSHALANLGFPGYNWHDLDLYGSLLFFESDFDTTSNYSITSSVSGHDVMFKIHDDTNSLDVFSIKNGNVGINTTSPSTIFEIGSSDLGDGTEGPTITLGRNTNATNTGAGSINFLSKAGTAGYVWQDAAGNMRINTSAPSNANDTAGTVIGTQTSGRNTKQDINDYIDYENALSLITNAPLHTFKYTKEVDGYGSDSPLAKTRIGFIADEVDPMFMWGNSIDQVSINGLLMASIKAMDLKIKSPPSVDNNYPFISVINNYLSDVNNAIESVFFGEIHTNKLCIDDLCIDKTQLEEILNNRNNSNNCNENIENNNEISNDGQSITKEEPLESVENNNQETTEVNAGTGIEEQ